MSFFFFYGMGVHSLNRKLSTLKTLPILCAPPEGGKQAQVWVSTQRKQPDSSIPPTLNKPMGPRKWLFLVNPQTHMGRASDSPCCPSRRSMHLGILCPCTPPFGFQSGITVGL